MSVALLVDFSNVLSARDSGDIPSSLLSQGTFDWESELYIRDLDNWESLDLIHETEKLNHLVARGGPNDHASAPPVKKAKKKIPKPNLQYRKRATGDQCMNLFVVWYRPLGQPPHQSARHWSLFLSEVADPAAVNAGAKGIIYEVIDDAHSPSNFRPHRVPEPVPGQTDLAEVQPNNTARYEGAKLLAPQLTSPNSMDAWFPVASEVVLDTIATHNNVQDVHHIMNPMNCQDFIVEIAVALDVKETAFSGVPK